MADLEKIFRITLYVFLIIVAILFIIAFYWIYRATNKTNDNNVGMMTNQNPSRFENESDGDETDIDLYESKQVEPKKYVYERFNHDLKLRYQPQARESTLNYEEFKSVVFTDTFLKNYYSALQVSLHEKEKIYRKKHKILNNELKSTQKRVGVEASNGFTHDSNLDGLKRASIEIREVLLAINDRLQNISIDKIRKDFEDAIGDPINGMDSLVGREDVKDLLALQIFTFARNPKLFLTSFQNMTIYGRSGVGKTKLAETIGFVYSKSGILVRRKVRSVTKQEFTSSYVNESSRLTRELLSSTLEGVLFIDEAYDLVPPPSLLGRGVDHGHEAVTELVNFLDKNMGLSIVIAAGYEKDMEERFIGANQGMDRRFPNKIRLSDYNSQQLTDILLKFINQSAPNIEFTNVEAGYLYTLIDFLYENCDDIFDKQAGDMLILSGCLSKSIYGSVVRRWSKQDHRQNALMLLDGFNDYLRDKGMSIEPSDFNFSESGMSGMPTPIIMSSSNNTPIAKYHKKSKKHHSDQRRHKKHRKQKHNNESRHDNDNFKYIVSPYLNKLSQLSPHINLTPSSSDNNTPYRSPSSVSLSQ